MKFEITSNLKPSTEEMNYCLPCFYEPKFNFPERFELENDMWRQNVSFEELRVEDLGKFLLFASPP